jgi:hypothetical protein
MNHTDWPWVREHLPWIFSHRFQIDQVYQDTIFGLGELLVFVVIIVFLKMEDK